MRPSDVARLLDGLFDSGVAVYLEGPPGCGKTALAQQLCQRRQCNAIFRHPVLEEPVDGIGVPFLSNGEGKKRTIWAPPMYLPDPDDKGEWLFFIDELPQSEPPMQKAYARTLLERIVGETPLPKQTFVLAAGNAKQHRAGAGKLFTHIRNRILVIKVDVSHEDWQQWALHNGIKVWVRSFLNFRPSLLMNFDAARDEQNATPRSWEQVSRISSLVPEELMMESVTGLVGEGPAAEAMAFRQIYLKLPDPDMVLGDPNGAKVPTEPAVLYALSGAIAERCRKGDAKRLGSAVIYAGRMPTEFGVLTVRDIAAINPQVLQTPEANQWLKKNRDLFLQDRTTKR